MKKIFVLASIAAAFLLGSCTTQNYMTADGVAVFVPEEFDPAQHLPSPIFVGELGRHGRVSSDWEIVPQFSTEEGKSVVRIDVADADFYGTGEVWGPLRRNGDRNIYWNRDNGAYGAHEGKELYQTHPWVLVLRKDGSSYIICGKETQKSSVSGRNCRFLF